MAYIRRNTKLLFVLVLPVYFYIVQNTIQNKHTHVFANGIVVTHSHPTCNDTENPFNDHEHSQKEICLYSSLNFDLYETPVWVAVDFEVEEVGFSYVVTDDEFKAKTVCHVTIPRAPPV